MDEKFAKLIEEAGAAISPEDAAAAIEMLADGLQISPGEATALAQEVLGYEPPAPPARPAENEEE